MEYEEVENPEWQVLDGSEEDVLHVDQMDREEIITLDKARYAGFAEISHCLGILVLDRVTETALVSHSGALDIEGETHPHLDSYFETVEGDTFDVRLVLQNDPGKLLEAAKRSVEKQSTRIDSYRLCRITHPEYEANAALDLEKGEFMYYHPAEEDLDGPDSPVKKID